MNQNGDAIVKILALSAIGAVVIKVWGPSWSIAPSNAHALVAVLSPSLLLGVLLGLRAWRSGSSSSD